MTKRLYIFGLLLAVSCNTYLDRSGNPTEQMIVNAALTEAQVRGLLENESWLLIRPLINNGVYNKRSEIPETIAGIPVKSNEWIFEREIIYGTIALDRITIGNEIHEIQFSYTNSIKDRITIQIKLDNDLEFQGYTQRNQSFKN